MPSAVLCSYVVELQQQVHQAHECNERDEEVLVCRRGEVGGGRLFVIR